MTEIIPLAKKGEEKHKHERSKKMKIQVSNTKLFVLL